VERLVLAGGEAALQVFRVGQGAREGRVRRRGRRVHEAARPHVDELALEVADDPVGGKGRDVPGKVERKTRRQEAEEPAGVELGARQTIDVPRAAEASGVKKLAGELPPEDVGLYRVCDARMNAHVGERHTQALRLAGRDH